MDYDRMIDSMTPDMYQALKQAIEIGKWPNGQALSQDQKETSLRAVIAYEHRKDIPEDQRVGFIDRTKTDGSAHGDDPLAPDVLKILNG